MNDVDDKSVHLAVTSPPYNCDMPYEKTMTIDDYEEFTRRWMHETWKKLVDGGRLSINIANINRTPRIRHDIMIFNIATKELGMFDRGEIIWDKGEPIVSSHTNWGSFCDATNPCIRDRHEFILNFSKGTPKLDCTGYAKTAFPDHSLFAKSTQSIWEISPETNRSHPAPFPLEIPSRLISLYTRPGQVVLDPFGGWGTTAIACILMKNRRKYICYEINDEYYYMALKRINQFSFTPLI